MPKPGGIARKPAHFESGRYASSIGRIRLGKRERAAPASQAARSLQAGGRRFDPVTAHVDAAQVSLLRWLRRQLQQPTPLREHLEAAVENDDPAEARRLVRRFEFSDAQRRNVDQLLDAWERTLGPTGR